MQAHSFNKATGVLGAQAGAGTAATLPNYGIKPAASEYADADGSISSNAVTGKYTLSTVYQTAMAGGSDSSAWSNGMWAMTNVAKNAKNSVLMGTAADGLTLTNDAYYQNGAGNFIGTDQAAGTPDNTVDLTAKTGTTGTAKTNSDSMSYADKTLMYTNWDTAISSSVSCACGTTATVEYESSSAQKGLTTPGTTTSSIGPAFQTFSGSRNLILYSLVNSDKPSGTSPAIFY